MQIETLHNLYSSSDIRVIKSGRIKWGGQVGHIREMRNVVKILVRKSERKRPLRIPCIDGSITVK